MLLPGKCSSKTGEKLVYYHFHHEKDVRHQLFNRTFICLNSKLTIIYNNYDIHSY